MTSRANFPYRHEDLFPHPPSANHAQPTPGLISGASFTETIRNGSHRITPARNLFSPTESSWEHWRKIGRRLLRPKTLDFETATWEMIHLIVNPRKMYRQNYMYRHSTKLSYSRDDPSFLVLLTGLLSLSAVAWGAVYLKHPSILNLIKLVLYMVVIDFYVTGVVISSISWIVANKLFNPAFGLMTAFSPVSRLNINYIEWAFCFDIHCNSFLVIWCLLYIVQFLTLPLVIRGGSGSVLAGNSLYFGAIMYYFVVTFYGFNSLPLITNSYSTRGPATSTAAARILQIAILAVAIPLLVVLWLLSVLVNFNIAVIMYHNYFS